LGLSWGTLTSSLSLSFSLSRRTALEEAALGAVAAAAGRATDAMAKIMQAANATIVNFMIEPSHVEPAHKGALAKGYRPKSGSSTVKCRGMRCCARNGVQDNNLRIFCDPGGSCRKVQK